MENPNPNPNPTLSNDSTSTTKSSSPSTQHPLPKQDSPEETNPITNEHSSAEEEKILKTALEVLVELKSAEFENGGEAAATDDSKVGVSEGQALKKRKNSDQTFENPICPKCKKVFSTWKTTMEHIQKHPNCTSSGSPSTTNPLDQPHHKDGGDEKQPLEVEVEVEGSSNANDEPEPEPVKIRIPLGLDLNQPPPDEEDEV